MASFLDTILLGKKYESIELFTLDGKESDSIAFLQLEKKGKEIAISRAETFDNYDSFTNVKSKSPLWITVNTSRVLQKQVYDTDSNDRKLLHKAFPNIKADEFYYDIWRNDTLSLVAVCRKSYIDGLLNEFAGLRVAGFSLGVNPVSNITGFDVPGVLFTNTQQLTISGEEAGIVPLNEPVNKSYIINGLEVSNNFLLCFAGALNLLLSGEGTTGNTKEQSAILMDTYRQKAFFEKGLTAGIALLLGVLFINFMLFSYYFRQSEELEQDAALHIADSESLKQISLRVNEKQEKVKTFTGTASSHSAVLINELVKELPHSISLSEITLHPIEKKIKDNEVILTNDTIITVSGTSLVTDDFTGWIADAEKLPLISKITIVSFGKGQGNSTDFTLRINTGKDEAQQ